MTPHDHTTYVEGCHRCELGRDEAADAISDQLKEAVAAALATLEEHGYPPERVILGISEPYRPGDVYYESHVGRTLDRDTSTVLMIIGKDLAAESQLQAQSLVRDEDCPECKSPRLAIKQRRADPPHGGRPGMYVEVLDHCMDCGYEKVRP